jgi:hypothetical protein
MRFALALILAASPAAAWEFTAVPVCTLTQDTGEAQVAVTYDPREAEPYAIAVTLGAGTWGDGPVFGIRFDGDRPLVITTDRHTVSGGGATLTVTDRGFGNVLDGIEFNAMATAASPTRAVAIPLDGAAEPMRAFRACVDGGTV